MLHWFYLLAAISFGVSGTMTLKYASINQTPKLTIFTGIGYTISFIFLYFAIKKIDVGIAYAIWAGVGTATVALCGVFIFKEKITISKAIFLLFIIVGALGLQYLSKI